MAEMNAAFFEEAKYNLQHGKINFLNVAGLIPEVAEERHVVVRLPANSMHLNHVNIVYAGSYFVLAESSGATLIKCTYAGKYVPIIKSVNIDYRKPTKRDLIVDISMTEEEAKERIAYVEEHGKGQYPLDVPVMDADGVHCADVHIVFYLMPKPYGEENPELVRDRARGLRLPETGNFRLGYIELDEQASVSKAGYMVLQLRAWSNVANYGVMQYQNSVLILFQDWHDYPVGEQLLFRERWDELLTLLGKNHAHIGVSLLFTELGRLRMGYDQARTAIEIGRKLDPDALEYHYSKYYLNDMLDCYREKFALDDVIVRYLDQLAGERGYSNSNLLLLYHYLNTERNISITAKRVHMHRNSVIYRLQRIQDVLNLDLDDPDVRLRLMITFKILQMEGKLPEITDEPPEPDNGGSGRLTLVE